jgi:large subunit ribosomal protein L6
VNSSLSFGKRMSRLGKQPIAIPGGVEVTVADGTITVKGPKGTLTKPTHELVTVTVADGTVTTVPVDDSKEANALWGTYAAHLHNLITGVTEGFEKKLEIEGVGYRAEAQGQNLTLNIGFSHPVVMSAPDGVTVGVEKNVISIAGIDKEVVGQYAANVRKVRPPEPYKGKGIRYQGEYIIRKQGKKAV